MFWQRVGVPLAEVELKQVLAVDSLEWLLLRVERGVRSPLKWSVRLINYQDQAFA